MLDKTRQDSPLRTLSYGRNYNKYKFNTGVVGEGIIRSKQQHKKRKGNRSSPPRIN